MNRKKMISLCMAVCLLGVSGCGHGASKQKEGMMQQSETVGNNEDEEDSENGTGQGFRPSAGSHVDKNGNIVDKEGNTFDKEGGWTVPEGGHVDSKGRIIDKDGNVMGGGAKIGSKG